MFIRMQMIPVRTNLSPVFTLNAVKCSFKLILSIRSYISFQSISVIFTLLRLTITI